MATQVQPRGKDFTPLLVLQIFASALIFSVGVLSIAIVALKWFYEWEPNLVSSYTYSPIYAVAAAGACLVLSFLIPELLLDSVRREIRKEKKSERVEDMPIALIPSIFIRYGLLAIVTIIGFVMAFAGRGVSVFIPFSLVSLVLMVAFFPTEARMKSWLSAH